MLVASYGPRDLRDIMCPARAPALTLLLHTIGHVVAVSDHLRGGCDMATGQQITPQERVIDPDAL